MFNSTGNDHGMTPGPLVSEAIATLVDDDERRGQEDVSVIGELQSQCWSRKTVSLISPGAIDENGNPVLMGESGFDVTIHILNSPFCIMPHCRMGDFRDIGCLSPPEPYPSDTILYPVTELLIFMVQSASLPILSLATGGAMTPYRLWILIMHKRYSGDKELGGINYGEVVRQTDPPPIPMLSKENLVALEELGDVELIRRTVVHQGGFWVWMRPDR